MIGYLLNLLLQIYCRVRWGKNFENRLAFRRVTGKNKVAPFFSGHGVVRHHMQELNLFKMVRFFGPPWSRSNNKYRPTYCMCTLSLFFLHLSSDLNDFEQAIKVTHARW